MAPFKEEIISTNEKIKVESALGARLRAVRVEVYGEHGIDTVCERLGVEPETWKHYEDIGEVMPAQTLLRFIELTGADPLWLMRGEGMRYRNGRRPGALDPIGSRTIAIGMSH